MNWTGEHRAFIVETFIKTNESLTATQRAFCLHFNLGRHDPVPARNTILLWVTNFRATGSALKRKSTGRPRSTRTPENVAARNQQPGNMDSEVLSSTSVGQDVNTTDETEEEDMSGKAKLAQADPAFYSDAAAYWSNIPATVNGMLGGFAHIHAPDISASERFLQSIFKMKDAPGHGRAADCGAGIGRITKHFLLKHFGKVDLVEQCQSFLDQAKESLKNSKKIGEYLCQGLQHFSPKLHTYDVIWTQWVLGHLTDTDLEKFFRRMAGGLKPNGVIIVKENVTSSGTVELDEQDSSVTRPESLLLSIIGNAELQVLKNVKQPNFPKGLYEVRMLCLKPK